jgi:undecaprenyl diphosphate synthase
MSSRNLRHIAIIMDGNGRWARDRGLPRTAGHREGAATVRRIISHCARIGVRHLTLYAFSTENWGRPAFEVNALMDLLARFLEQEHANLVARGIELAVIGDPGRLPAPARTPLHDAIEATRGGERMRLTLALSYGGHDEIVRTARSLARRVADGRLRIDEIDLRGFEHELDTRDTPPVDLLVRTGGERRLSNFLLWQAAYAELYFTDCQWPEFRPKDLDRAISWFRDRRRTFGLVEAAG